MAPFSGSCCIVITDVATKIATVCFLVHCLTFRLYIGVKIEQKYLERRHTQVEVDSTHTASLNESLNNREIFHPGEYTYVRVMKEARTPYVQTLSGQRVVV